ncbi:MAG TPA: hypothetical protein DCS93_07320 [Microscillaceae bacterium]|nr:hypothetical protein [Microscillaceae bacterium]
MKNITFCCVLLLLSSVTQAQNKQIIDSLKKVLKNGISKKQKVDIYNMIANEYRYANYAQVADYTSKAKKLAQNIHYLKGVTDAQYYLGWITMIKGDYPEALRQFNLAYQTATQARYKKGLANARNGQGVTYWFQGKYLLALEMYQESLNIKKQLGDEKSMAGSYNNLGKVYRDQGNYPKALKMHQQALEIRERLGDKKGMAFSYSSIGLVYYRQSEYSKALKMFQKTLKLREEIGDRWGKASCYHNIGKIYRVQGKYFKADSAIQKGQQIGRLIESKRIIAQGHLELGRVALDQNKADVAQVHFKQALDLRQKTGEKDLSAEVLINIGIAYFIQKKYLEAQNHLTKGVQEAKKTGNPVIIRDGSEYLAKTYQMMGSFEKALESHRLFKRMADSLFNKNTIRQLTLLEAQRHADSLSAVREKQKTRKAKENNQRNRNFIIALVVLGLILLLTIVVLWRLYLGKQRSHRQLVRLNTRLNNSNEEIRHQQKELKEQNIYLGQAYQNIRELTTIGQQITASLDLDTILQEFYQNINHLMDADNMGIGLYNAEHQVIHYRLIIERGQRKKPYTRSLKEKNQLAVWCITNRQPILMWNVANDYSTYLDSLEKSAFLPVDSENEIPTSLMYVPLMNGNQVLGCMSVQSYQRKAYQHYHFNLLHNLAIYVVIALKNAQEYSKKQQMLHELQNTQAQLVQAEKMASLGQLTAGIAHEINNPINFVSSNIDSLSANLKDILMVVDAYQQLKPDDLLNQIHLIEKLKEKVQYQDALEEMDELLLGIQEGSQRTAEIVKGLRLFSRIDEDILIRTDIHTNIDTTLLMLRNQYKDRISIEKSYGQIPAIDCYPGKLNQVFMNLLANAIQAIKDKGTIHITTEIKNNDYIQVIIQDSGPGIPKEVQPHVFEPFFTTKAVGQGTGLGLSISLGIIEKHQGKIVLESEENQGTIFKVILPIEQKKES